MLILVLWNHGLNGFVRKEEKCFIANRALEELDVLKAQEQL